MLSYALQLLLKKWERNMRTILLLIYSINIYANNTDKKGCTISFFKKEEPCSSAIEKKKITISPIIIKEMPKKKSIEEKATDTKKTEEKLRTILSNIKQYKNKNELKTNKLREELTAMKNEFNQYKLKKNRELKKVKSKLYSSNKELKDNEQKLVRIQQEIIITHVVEEKKPILHKVIRKMKPLPVLMYDTPWIEIIVEDNTNIYELALKYYGNEQEYKKIYLANQNVIANDFKIYNGMSLIIPMTGTFEEQPIMLNTY